MQSFRPLCELPFIAQLPQALTDGLFSHSEIALSQVFTMRVSYRHFGVPSSKDISIPANELAKYRSALSLLNQRNIELTCGVMCYADQFQSFEHISVKVGIDTTDSSEVRMLLG